MAVKLDAARLLIHRAAARAGRGFPDALEAAKAKTFAAGTAQEGTSQALQIHDAAGYGRSLPPARGLRFGPAGGRRVGDALSYARGSSPSGSPPASRPCPPRRRP